MSTPFLFGERRLFGLLHATPASLHASSHALVLCAPLLQDGIRTHRAMWSLADAVGHNGVPTLAFDWRGTGDSAGDDDQLTLAGMQMDLAQVEQEIALRFGPVRVQWLALRSAALPLLAHLSKQRAAADVVLWEPQLHGRRLVLEWREQHRAQLYESGRYVHARHEPDADDLLGFRVDPALLESLAAMDASRLPLPNGSRVRIAVWEMDDELERFAQSQRGHGVSVEAVLLDEGERPEWSVPARFGAQVFPRRAVTQLAQRLTAQVSW